MKMYCWHKRNLALSVFLYIAVGKFWVIQNSPWTSSCGSAKWVLCFTDRKIAILSVSAGKKKKKDPWQDHDVREKQTDGRKCLLKSLRIPSSNKQNRCFTRSCCVQVELWCSTSYGKTYLLTNAFLNNRCFEIFTMPTPPFSLFEGMWLLILGCLLTPSIRLVHGKSHWYRCQTCGSCCNLRVCISLEECQGEPAV